VFLEFDIEMFARRIVDFFVSNSIRTDFIYGAVELTLFIRHPKGDESWV
jgi:hypothetical protein